jgi:signal peptidase II
MPEPVLSSGSGSGPARSACVMLVVASLVFLADFLSKQWALAHLQMGTTKIFVPYLLGLTLVTNSGTAFGMWRNERLVGLLLPPIICLGIIYWIVHRERSGALLSNLERCGFGMVLGGAIGNVVDRILQGEVTDFIFFPFFPSFPVFNLADALIDTGVALIIMHALFFPKQPIRNDSQHE